jgi:hypothetical protein
MYVSICFNDFDGSPLLCSRNNCERGRESSESKRRERQERDEEAFVCCLVEMAMVDGDGDGALGLGKERRFSEFGKSKEGEQVFKNTLLHYSDRERSHSTLTR